MKRVSSSSNLLLKEKPRYLLAGFFSLLLFSPFAVFAQERSYWYDNIIVDIQINKDTTVNVTEKQTYSFQGEYHQGWREIPHDKIDTITDISVSDAYTGEPLLYSRKRLDKTDPESWGKFTNWVENGKTIIEWYYDARDIKKTWVITYTVHGALGFYDGYDELYWNLFTDYTVPVRRASATIVLPEFIPEGEKLEARIYRTAVEKPALTSISDRKTLYYEFLDVDPREAVTVVAQWQEGVIDRSAYWKDYLKTHWGFILGCFIVLTSLMFAILRWYFTEKYHTGRGTIIPQYEPPENLRPAMAEVIIKEGVSNKAWTATIIDLAVRGYLKISEDTKKEGAFNSKAAFFALAAIAFIFFLILMFFAGGIGASVVLVVGVLSFSVGIGGRNIFQNLISKDYIIEKTGGGDILSLEDYEKKFLELLFAGRGYFSTKEFKKSKHSEGKNKFVSGIQKLKLKLLKETEVDTKAYAVGFSAEQRRAIVLTVIFTTTVLLLNFPQFFFPALAFLHGQGTVLSIFFIVAGFIIFFALNDARLNKRGQILREDWLGFKMFLETAERYRMQNLTPNMFEKYLPYAVIFGIEKKWARAFESFDMPPPSWYSGAGVHVGTSGNFAGSSFSPSSFTSSFSASFASSFSSSGGGAGGGGSAGGGGGGGGGGAS